LGCHRSRSPLGLEQRMRTGFPAVAERNSWSVPDCPWSVPDCSPVTPQLDELDIRQEQRPLPTESTILRVWVTAIGCSTSDLRMLRGNATTLKRQTSIGFATNFTPRA
jgi:hypothetical protein